MECAMRRISIPAVVILMPVILMAAAAAAAERTFPVTAFDSVLLAGSPDAEISVGPAASVRAIGKADELDQLAITVQGSTLRIGLRKGNHGGRWNSASPRVLVTVPALVAARIAGSGNMTIDRLAGPRFAGSVAGSGDLAITASTAADIRLDISGSGDIAVAGRCTTATLAIDGSGDIAAAGLKCETVGASLVGSGDITASASRTASLGLKGSGDITITGGARCQIAKAGSGEAACS
jgi:hypothetical protein